MSQNGTAIQNRKQHTDFRLEPNLSLPHPHWQAPLRTKLYTPQRRPENHLSPGTVHHS